MRSERYGGAKCLEKEKKSKKRNVVLDTLRNGESVKLDMNRYNRVGAGDDSCCVMYHLKWIKEGFFWETREKCNAIIQTRGDQHMNQD